MSPVHISSTLKYRTHHACRQGEEVVSVDKPPGQSTIIYQRVPEIDVLSSPTCTIVANASLDAIHMHTKSPTLKAKNLLIQSV